MQEESKAAKSNFSGLVESGEPVYYYFEGKKYAEKEFATLYSSAQNIENISNREQIKDNNSISSYPNPIINYGSTVVNIHLAEPKTLTIEIKNEAGQLLLTPLSSMNFQAGDIEFDFGTLNLVNGVYFVHAVCENETIAVNKILITRK